MGAPSSHADAYRWCSALSCWFLGLAGWISVASLASRSCAKPWYPEPQPQTTTTVNRREGPHGRDSPPEKISIVTQLVTRRYRASIVHCL